MLETIFLVVLVLALLLGNVFLSVTGSKRPRLVPEKELQVPDAPEGQAVARPFFLEPGAIEGQPIRRPLVSGQSFSTAEKEPSFEAEAEKERIDYLNRRMARLEQLLLKLNGSKPIAEKINGSTLSQKIGDLDEFKQNTRLEISALKQRLDKLQPLESKPKANVLEISDEKLRDLVFRASH